MAKRKTETLAAERADQGTVDIHEPTHTEIQERAYYRYIDRGRVDGFDREDWHQAEAELRPANSLIQLSA
jgi:Protein of unknown function (DUF2934)